MKIVLLEYKMNRRDDGDVFSVEQLEDRAMLSTVQIFAAGQTGQEQMDLFIDGDYVQSFQNVGGNISTRDFEIFTFQTDQILTADQIGVAFGNDAFDPATGFDRNLSVDKIVLDGVTYETEDASTFSTGIWRNGYTGPGNFQTEFMNINAIFTYSPAGAVSDTFITADVQGQSGDEVVEILVDDQVVGAYDFDFAGQRRTAQVAVGGNVDLDQVTIRFSNDLYDPVNSIDRNLNVYSFSINQVRTGRFEVANTNDTNVYSEGVWRNEDGIQSGFGRGSQLFANGFIEIRDNPNGDSDLRLDQSFANNGLDSSSTQNLEIGPDGEIATSRFGEITLRNADGSLITGFGGNGKVDLAELMGNQIGLGDGLIRITDLDFFADSTLLAVGYLEPLDFNSQATPIIAKLTPQGDLDSFYQNGILTGPEFALATRVFAGPIKADIDSNGDAILAGTKVDDFNDIESERNPNIVISRLNSNGTLDTSFGNDGNTFLDRDLFPGVSAPDVVEVEAPFDGDIHVVVAGSSNSTIIKLNYDGTLDTDFSGDGLYYTNQSDVFDGGVRAVEFEVDSQGRIVLGGTRYRFTRVTAGGELDTSFGNNGEAEFVLNPPVDLLNSRFTQFFLDDFVIDDQDRILGFSGADHVVVGRAGAPTRIQSAGTVAFRLDALGNADTSFGSNGYTVVGVGVGGQSVSEAAIDQNGNLIVTGNLYTAADRLGTDPTVASLKFI